MKMKLQSQLEDLDGFVGLAMHKDARGLARRLLEAPNLSAPEFERIYLAVLKMDGMVPSSSLKKWRRPIERGFSHLLPSARKRVQHRMLSLYYNLGDYKKAGLFLRSKPLSEIEMCYTLEVLKELGRLTEAEPVARLCERALKTASDSDRDSLRRALASYYARAGDYSKAVEHLSQIGLYDHHGIHAVVKLVEIRIADAIRTTRSCMKALEKLRKYGKKGRVVPDISQCDYTQSIIAHANIRLITLLDDLERFMPKHRQIEFGL